MNVIWQISNDVNLIDKHKQKKKKNAEMSQRRSNFFKALPPLSCSMLQTMRDVIHKYTLFSSKKK